MNNINPKKKQEGDGVKIWSGGVLEYWSDGVMEKEEAGKLGSAERIEQSGERGAGRRKKEEAGKLRG